MKKTFWTAIESKIYGTIDKIPQPFKTIIYIIIFLVEYPLIYGYWLCMQTPLDIIGDNENKTYNIIRKVSAILCLVCVATLLIGYSTIGFKSIFGLIILYIYSIWFFALMYKFIYFIAKHIANDSETLAYQVLLICSTVPVSLIIYTIANAIC